MFSMVTNRFTQRRRDHNKMKGIGIIMKKVSIIRYDAFTNAPGKGNPAGGIIDGDSYDEAQMQEIAKVVGSAI